LSPRLPIGRMPTGLTPASGGVRIHQPTPPSANGSFRHQHQHSRLVSCWLAGARAAFGGATLLGAASGGQPGVDNPPSAWRFECSLPMFPTQRRSASRGFLRNHLRRINALPRPWSSTAFRGEGSVARRPANVRAQVFSILRRRPRFPRPTMTPRGCAHQSPRAFFLRGGSWRAPSSRGRDFIISMTKSTTPSVSVKFKPSHKAVFSPGQDPIGRQMSSGRIRFPAIHLRPTRHESLDFHVRRIASWRGGLILTNLHIVPEPNAYRLQRVRRANVGRVTFSIHTKGPFTRPPLLPSRRSHFFAECPPKQTGRATPPCHSRGPSAPPPNASRLKPRQTNKATDRLNSLVFGVFRCVALRWRCLGVAGKCWRFFSHCPHA